MTSKAKYQDTGDQIHHDHNQKGRLQKNNVAFWQNFFSYKYTRLTYGILCREIQEENEEGKRNQHDSKNGQDGKHQSLI